MTKKKLSHIGSDGAARMVNVGLTDRTHRIAVAGGELRMKPATLAIIRQGGAAKGNVLETARIAGIQAGKRAAALIPLCHSIALTNLDIRFSPGGKGILRLTARAEAMDRTGVEMEALTAVAVCALTVYDMIKAVDRGVEIDRIRLLEKTGGKSGTFLRQERSKPKPKLKLKLKLKSKSKPKPKKKRSR